MKIDIEFNWLLNYFCNFQCTYCYFGENKAKGFVGLPDTKKVTDGFNNTGKICLIYMTGGEPFFFPNFIELCQKLTQKHFLAINTNLSHKEVFSFAELINPEKVKSINCSLHIQERDSLKQIRGFIEKYKRLEEKGFYTFVSYVMYPPVINRFEKDYAYFKSEGIILRPKVLRGKWSRLEIGNSGIFRKIKNILEPLYPNAYTEMQKSKIISYIDKSQKDGDFIVNHENDAWEGRMSDLGLDKLFIDGMPSFKGKYCLAGKTFVRMTPTGEVYRCYDDNYYLGNLFERKITLFEKPAKCMAKRCNCPYIGYRHVLRKSENPSKEIANIAQ